MNFSKISKISKCAPQQYLRSVFFNINLKTRNVSIQNDHNDKGSFLRRRPVFSRDIRESVVNFLFCVANAETWVGGDGKKRSAPRLAKRSIVRSFSVTAVTLFKGRLGK